MLRLGNVYGPFLDWVRSHHGIEFISSNRKKLDVSRSSVHQVYLNSSDLYVVAFTNARGTSRFLHHGGAKGRRLPSLWDWECVVHGPQTARTEGSCGRCGRATILTIIWRDKDAVSSLVGPVRIVKGRIMYVGRLFEPGEVLDILMTRDGALYARVLGFEVIEVELPDHLIPADVAEVVWTPPREVVADWR